MKLENLKLYHKYIDVNKPNEELIYIGIDQRDDNYVFLFKTNISCFDIPFLCTSWGLNYNDIKKHIEKYKTYDRKYFHKEDITKLKPLLKNKLKNIINR